MSINGHLKGTLWHSIITGEEREEDTISSPAQDEETESEERKEGAVSQSVQDEGGVVSKKAPVPPPKPKRLE